VDDKGLILDEDDHLEGSHGGGRLALVVDDDADTRAVVREYLEDSGFRVRTASNGQEAELFLEQALPDAILLDLNMPIMDGWTFLERFRAEPRNKSVPVVIITAKDLTVEERNRLEAQAAGIVPMREGFQEGLDTIMSGLFLVPGGAPPPEDEDIPGVT
jgi:CheY-like chemotaxis protein